MIKSCRQTHGEKYTQTSRAIQLKENGAGVGAEFRIQNSEFTGVQGVAESESDPFTQRKSERTADFPNASQTQGPAHGFSDSGF